jgi:hypothetical protein
VESGEADDADRGGLRLLTPLAKLFTARQAVAAASEALEGFGGAGYVEDTGLPVWLRNAQVLPIWEGTTNVLALDVLRAAAGHGALDAWAGRTRERIAAFGSGALAPPAAALSASLDEALAARRQAMDAGPLFVEAGARRWALRLATVAAGLGLCEQAAWSLAEHRGERSLLAARRFLSRPMPPLLDASQADERLRSDDLLAAMEPPSA